ncbi:AAA family ATPase [Tranquillimonas alkanivorans]|uniref:AAA domain-containing protein n=1 Tax=Tranquillimonas alkanivorans TaxID=441119 RepID=A0A1I5RX57_9RHOB|nr:helicase RepA family protein [Tranquillimonas alkanivorans]SFP63024.1 AAA domain-containing protein [Tranquillimonas alkanivorans]
MNMIPKKNEFSADHPVVIRIEERNRLLAWRNALARRPEAIAEWFPALNLPNTRHERGYWEADATWPADRLIYRDEEDEAKAIGGEQVEMVPWPWSHRVRLDAAGEVMAEGMDDHLEPLDLICHAMGWIVDMEPEEGFSPYPSHDCLEMAWGWLRDVFGLSDGTEEVIEPPAEEEKPAKSGFQLVRVSDLVFQEPSFSIDGLLETSSMALMFGDPGCGKSFLAIDMASCIAAGVPFHGRETKQAPVIYIAGEGNNGLKRRTVAWERHRGLNLGEAPLYFSKVAAELLDANAARAVTAAVDQIAATVGRPGLIVIDTLSRNFGPGDENATADMRSFVAAVDRLKDRYDAAALIVHHTGHSDKGRARGNSTLRAALDAEYRVELDGDRMLLSPTKMKDVAPPPPLSFEMKQVDIGVTTHGEVISSVALDETDRQGPSQRRKLSPAQRLGLKTFFQAAQECEGFDRAVSVEDWRPHFYAAHTADTAHAKKVAFQRARQSLVEAGELSVLDDVYRFIGTNGDLE